MDKIKNVVGSSISDEDARSNRPNCMNSSSKFQELDIADIDVDFLSSKKFFLDENEEKSDSACSHQRVQYFLQKKYIILACTFIAVFCVASCLLLYNMRDENVDDLPIIKAENIKFKEVKNINHKKNSDQKIYSYITNEDIGDDVYSAKEEEAETFDTDKLYNKPQKNEIATNTNRNRDVTSRRKLRQEMVNSIIVADDSDDKTNTEQIDTIDDLHKNVGDLKVKPKKSLKNFFRKKSKNINENNINGGIFIPSLYFNSELDAYKYYDYIARVCPFVKQYGHNIMKVSNEKNGTRYKILIGPFSDIEDADNVATNMIERGVQVIW